MMGVTGTHLGTFRLRGEKADEIRCNGRRVPVRKDLAVHGFEGEIRTAAILTTTP